LTLVDPAVSTFVVIVYEQVAAGIGAPDGAWPTTNPAIRSPWANTAVACHAGAESKKPMKPPMWRDCSFYRGDTPDSRGRTA
jgi:hypothetical protein